MTELNDPTLSALRKRIMLDDTLWENGLPRGEAINTIVAMIDDADATLARPEPDREAAVLPERFPRVQGRCPACGRGSLMLASGGYVTCASLSCRDPEAASKALDESSPEHVVAPLPTEAAVEDVLNRYATGSGAQQMVVADVRAALFATDQRVRDEGTVRRAVLDAIEDEGPDTENPASRERIRGWRECAQDVRDALDSVQDEETVRVPREAVERLRRAYEGYVPDTDADAGLDRAAGAVLDGSR